MLKFFLPIAIILININLQNTINNFEIPFYCKNSSDTFQATAQTDSESSGSVDEKTLSREDCAELLSAQLTSEIIKRASAILNKKNLNPESILNHKIWDAGLKIKRYRLLDSIAANQEEYSALTTDIMKELNNFFEPIFKYYQLEKPEAMPVDKYIHFLKNRAIPTLGAINRSAFLAILKYVLNAKNPSMINELLIFGKKKINSRPKFVLLKNSEILFIIFRTITKFQEASDFNKVFKYFFSLNEDFEITALLETTYLSLKTEVLKNGFWNLNDQQLKELLNKIAEICNPVFKYYSFNHYGEASIKSFFNHQIQIDYHLAFFLLLKYLCIQKDLNANNSFNISIKSHLNPRISVATNKALLVMVLSNLACWQDSFEPGAAFFLMSFN